MKDYYIFYYIVNGVTEDMVKLRYLGEAGANKWLHFQNVKTKENHLCSPKQFPLHTIKVRERSLTFRYEEDTGQPILQPRERPKGQRPSRFFQHSKRFI